MSGYFTTARHPDTGVVQQAARLQHYYGHGHDAIRFPDGTVVEAELCQVPTNDPAEVLRRDRNGGDNERRQAD